jgi:transposase InsO family protein
MSRVASPYDNAMAESFMKTLKQEEVNGTAYRKLVHARAEIGSFIEQVTTASGSTRQWPICHPKSMNNARLGLLRSNPRQSRRAGLERQNRWRGH